LLAAITNKLKRNDRRQKALITGIPGHDGSYLSELLSRRLLSPWDNSSREHCNTSLIDPFMPIHTSRRPMFLSYGDISDSVNLGKLITLEADEIIICRANPRSVDFYIPE